MVEICVAVPDAAEADRLPAHLVALFDRSAVTLDVTRNRAAATGGRAA
jgi:hypothetical protein